MLHARAVEAIPRSRLVVIEKTDCWSIALYGVFTVLELDVLGARLQHSLLINTWVALFNTCFLSDINPSEFLCKGITWANLFAIDLGYCSKAELY